jgi:hypothetical protein
MAGIKALRQDVRDEILPFIYAMLRKVNMRPLIFLDIDYVLCISEEFNSAQVMFCFKNEDLDWPDLWANIIDISAAERLKSLHDEFNPLYIVSSSWASYLSRTQMSEVFSRTKLSFVQKNMHEKWCSSQPRKCHDEASGKGLTMNRLQQIEGWLNSSTTDCQAFIVVDDTFSGESLIDSRLAREGVVVFCQVKIGFTAERLDEARQSLLKQLAVMDSRIQRDLSK